MIRLLLLFLSACLFACEPPKVNSQQVGITFGNTKWSIPKKYFLPELPSTLVPLQGLDKDVGVLLEIPLRDLGYGIKKGIGHSQNLTFLVTPLKVHHPPIRLLPPAFLAWQGSGLYKNRFIEFDKMIQLYRVYDDAEYRTTWEFFKSYPNSSKVPETEWVAGCLIGPLEKETPNLSNVTCKTTFLYKDIHVQMTLSGMYIKLIEEFKQKVLELFRSWEF